ncbi:hypothetical protein ACFWIJ_23125 [Streptomyces sp. NPDC127079]|uniref:hypothetical protein n=1 Tax=Streptomyces sp. NPDC127079 TaxID=3347132 RepID=UPI0036682E57
MSWRLLVALAGLFLEERRTGGADHLRREVTPDRHLGGQVGLDAQLAGEDAVALGVGVAQAVAVFVGDPLVGPGHGRDDLADEFVLVREGGSSRSGL